MIPISDVIKCHECSLQGLSIVKGPSGGGEGGVNTGGRGYYLWGEGTNTG